MEKIKKFFKRFISVVIVMIGVVFLSFYMLNEFSVVSIISGALGFYVLFPAIDKWDERLWGKDKN